MREGSKGPKPGVECRLLLLGRYASEAQERCSGAPQTTCEHLLRSVPTIRQIAPIINSDAMGGVAREGGS